MLRVDTFFTGSLITGGGINQLYFQNLGSDAQACTDAVQDFWDAIAARMKSTVSYETSDTVTEFDETTGTLEAIHPVSTEGSKPGLGTGDALPTATQGLIRTLSAVVANGRIVRGRVFVPGCQESDSGADGKPFPVMRDAFDAAALALINDVTVQWAIWHRPNDQLVTPGQGALVVSASTWEEWAVLRSRRD